MGLRTQKRRRREQKTDYRLRMGLLKSGIPRIVVRRTNKYFLAQAVESHEAQDKVIVGVSSRDLLNLGWDKKAEGSLKSIPAGYLTGLLLAKKLKSGKFILDLGMTRTIAGNRTYAVVKGLVDGGLDVPANKKVFPSEERINGDHMKDNMKAMIEKVRGGIK